MRHQLVWKEASGQNCRRIERHELSLARWELPTDQDRTRKRRQKAKGTEKGRTIFRCKSQPKRKFGKKGRPFPEARPSARRDHRICGAVMDGDREGAHVLFCANVPGRYGMIDARVSPRLRLATARLLFTFDKRQRNAKLDF